jgi:hypothetical protein
VFLRGDLKPQLAIRACTAISAPGRPFCRRSDARDDHQSDRIAVGVEGSVHEAAGSAAAAQDGRAVVEVPAGRNARRAPEVVEILVHAICPFGWKYAGRETQNCDGQDCVIGAHVFVAVGLKRGRAAIENP